MLLLNNRVITAILFIIERVFCNLYQPSHLRPYPVSAGNFMSISYPLVSIIVNHFIFWRFIKFMDEAAVNQPGLQNEDILGGASVASCAQQLRASNLVPFCSISLFALSQ